MTLSPSIFRNFSVAILALFYTALTFGALVTPTAAQARSQPAYYIAELAAPASESRAIIRGVVWSCNDTSCVAGKGNSRPQNTCKRLADEFGEVTRFSAKGKELSAEDLAACNS